MVVRNQRSRSLLLVKHLYSKDLWPLSAVCSYLLINSLTKSIIWQHSCFFDGACSFNFNCLFTSYLVSDLCNAHTGCLSVCLYISVSVRRTHPQVSVLSPVNLKVNWTAKLSGLCCDVCSSGTYKYLINILMYSLYREPVLKLEHLHSASIILVLPHFVMVEFLALTYIAVWINQAPT